MCLGGGEGLWSARRRVGCAGIGVQGGFYGRKRGAKYVTETWMHTELRLVCMLFRSLDNGVYQDLESSCAEVS